MRWRAFCDEVLDYVSRTRRDHVRHARRAAGRRPAHPAGAGHRRLVRPGPGRAARAGAVALLRPDRHRRRASGRGRSGADLPTLVVLGRGAALRRAAAVAQGHPRAAGPARGPARARRSTSGRCPRRPRPGSAASTSWPPTTPRWPTTCARSRRSATPPTCRRRPATRSPASSSATSRRTETPDAHANRQSDARTVRSERHLAPSATIYRRGSDVLGDGSDLLRLGAHWLRRSG